ncbi:MAG: HlyD family efflux transporter periplasmic adaptor subunit [Lentisphaerae bacterium]|nr:HlyD family efflux transporter periplasmic adaptor subunit [Lentisphaerota bacterium]
MNPLTRQTDPKPSVWRRARVGVAGLLVLLALGVLLVRRLLPGGGDETGPLYTVRENPLTISVVTAGTVQSRRTVTVRSQAEGRNTVIWIIDEGRTVTNGQLLVELDASALADRKTDQQILVGNAESALIAATEKQAIARIERESSVSAAELKLQLARLEQEKYQKGEYPQTLQESESKIALAREEVERAAESLGWTRKLAAEGYLTRSELQADEMAVKQKQTSLAAAVTSMSVLTNYSSRQQQATLASNLRQAEMELERVQRQTRANVVQAESDLKARELEAERQRAKLSNLELQIANCRIVAPTNGVVIYQSTMQAASRRWGGEPLQAGSTVVERQELLQIPIDGDMIVELSVPESSLTKLKLGQIARVKADALPGAEFTGRLSKIGLLPDGRNAWLNPDLQLYNCVIELDAPGDLRSGMNCETDMMIEHHERAFYVPIQCVIRVAGQPVVYVVENGRAVKRPVKLGLDNNRVVHVVEGLAEGEQVQLNPPLEAGATGASNGRAPSAGATAPGSAVPGNSTPKATAPGEVVQEIQPAAAPAAGNTAPVEGGERPSRNALPQRPPREAAQPAPSAGAGGT